MRKPPCWVRSVFQCSLWTLLCARWFTRFCLTSKAQGHETNTGYILMSDVSTVRFLIWNDPSLLLKRVVPKHPLSFLLHNRTLILAPNCLSEPLYFNTRDGKTSLTTCTDTLPCTWSWYGEGHVWRDICFVCFWHQQTARIILQLCFLVSYLKP